MNTVEHKGVIVKIDGEKIKVRIESLSMCAHCSAQKSCGTMLSTDSKEKDIDVVSKTPDKYKLGEEVTVCMEQRLGRKAVVLGFVYPFLVLVVPIIVLKLFVFPSNDAICVLIAFALMALYYLGLYLKKDKIEKKFSFFLKD